MTPAEARAAFQNYIDQWTTGRTPSIDFWINEGIRGYVKMLLSPQMYGTEKDQRISENLAPLIVFDETVANASGVITKPSTLYELLPHGVRCTHMGVSRFARRRTMDWYFTNMELPLTKPRWDDERVIYLQHSNKIEVKPSLTYDTNITYVKNWLPFDNDNTIPLAAKCHDDVVKMSASKYLLAINNKEGGKNLFEQVFIES